MNTIKLNTIGEAPIKKGGAGGGGGNYVYFDTSSIPVGDEIIGMLLQISYIVKEAAPNSYVFSTPGIRVNDAFPVIAVGIDLNLKLTASNGEELTTDLNTLEEMITKYASWILDLPRITEEEFYKIPTQFITRLGGSYEDIYYMYDEGMTWREWINSNYNNIGAFISNWDSVVWKTPEGYNCTFYSDEYGSTNVKPNDLIVSQVYYPVIDG